MAPKNTASPFYPTLNSIRSALPSELRGQDVAEAFDSIGGTIAEINTKLANLKTGVSNVTNQFNTFQQTQASGTQPANTPNGSSFSAITSGTNIQATMVVSSGASLEYDPSPGATGVVNANEIGTINVDGNLPTHAGQVLISQPGNTTAVWADPQIQGLYPEGSSITNPPAYVAPTTIEPVLLGVSASDALYALRTTDTFKTAQTSGGTSLQLAVWTPASGKAFRLMKIWISISGDAGHAGSGVLLTLGLTDGPAGPSVGPAFDIYIPPSIVGNVGGVFDGLVFNTGLIDMGNGYLSIGADRTLYLTANVLLATGKIRLNLFGTEE